MKRDISISSQWRDIIIMIKLVFGSKNKIIKLEKPTFQGLNSLIQQSFSDIPVDYSLSYLDTDKDEICLNSDQDLHIMLNSGIKINKIYIKQSLSQAIQITDRIEPSFQIYEHKPEDKEVKDNTTVLQKQQTIIQQIVPQVEIEKVQAKVQDAKVVIEESQQKKQVQQKKEVVNVVVDKKAQVGEPVSKSYVLNISDTNKIQLLENALNEKIIQFVQKVITNKQGESKIKQIEQKKEVVVEKPQVKTEVKQEKREVVEREEIKPSKQDKQQRQQQQKKDKQQRPFLKKENMSELIYHNVICAQCNDEYGIIGIRYQCIFCERYDLCSICEQKVEHEHSLLKVKIPKQAVSKDQIINRYRKQILASKEQLPNNHYVPSISRDEAKTYLQAGKKMMAQSFEKTQNLMNDFFLKLQMSHKNPYQVNKPKPMPPKKEATMRQKIDYLIDFLGITDREASAFCHKHYGFTKQQLLNLYMQKRASKVI